MTNQLLADADGQVVDLCALGQGKDVDPTAPTNPEMQQSCTIAGVCYAAVQRDPTGCKTCDPAQDKTSWT